MDRVTQAYPGRKARSAGAAGRGDPRALGGLTLEAATMGTSLPAARRAKRAEGAGLISRKGDQAGHRATYQLGPKTGRKLQRSE
jgi:hypothetical protein